jgi:hypothetical protein
MFIAITMNHFRAIKAWGDAHGGQATLDALTFELELRARNRYHTLHPQFLAQVNGGLAHVPALSPQVTGFVGWRPYRPFRHALSSDKLVFKQAAHGAGVATPAWWDAPENAAEDFVIKYSVGSFGQQLTGPFRAGSPAGDLFRPWPSATANPGRLYAEKFVQGDNVKVWFWGGQAVHAQCHPYPVLRGDGVRPVSELLGERLAGVGGGWAGYPEQEAVLQNLAFQGLSMDAVLPAGGQAWLDYRYGRRFAADESSEQADNALPRLDAALRRQIDTAGQWIAAALTADLGLPVLVSMDAVRDADGTLWWLEMNSNPICPPTAYFAMLSTLFDTPADIPHGVFRNATDPLATAAPGSPPAPAESPASRPAAPAKVQA